MCVINIAYKKKFTANKLEQGFPTNGSHLNINILILKYIFLKFVCV